MQLNRLMKNKKRAISPVIAVILLIGLAVAASAAIFLVILPLLSPTSNLQINDAFVIYDADYTKNLDQGEGFGKGTITVANVGTGEINLLSMKVFWGSTVSGPWNEITAGVASFQNISNSNPYTVPPLTTDKDLSVRFPIPVENDNQTLFYRLTLQTDEGATLDTSLEEETVSSNDMRLIKDQPDISFTGTIGTIRKTNTISPVVDDNAGIKNVTYEVSADPSFSSIDQTKVITDSSLWQWSWNTFNYTTEGLDNGTYYIRITVYDYAGLSAVVEPGSFVIDNDYIAPNIDVLWITDPYPNNQTGEVGESISLTVEILDGGTQVVGASEVESVFLYHRVSGSSDVYNPVTMSRSGLTNNWTGTISSGFVDSVALDNGLESYVVAADDSGNIANTSGALKQIPVTDNFGPDIVHTPIPTASINDNFINISATITDKDQVNESKVMLYYRQTDDLGGKTEQWIPLSPFISGSQFSWIIWSFDINIHGLDYFFNATDRYSGHVSYEGRENTPNHIIIPDVQKPVISHAVITSATENFALQVDATIFDNDPTFGAEGSETGTVTLYYRDYDSGGTFLSTSMTRISGNSSIDSNSETPSPTLWSGTIPAGVINDDLDPRLDYYIFAQDQGTNSEQDGVPFHMVPVVAQGQPNIVVVPNSVKVSGTIGEQLDFAIRNKAGSGTGAEMAKLNLTILSSTADFSTDFPKLNSTTFNLTQVWSNPSGVTNSTWITFSTNFTIGEGAIANITMTFENASNQPYSMHDLNVELEFEAVSDTNVAYERFIKFSTPPGTTTISDKFYMTSNFLLSTTPTFSQMTVSSPRINIESPIIQWGIRVFVGSNQLTSSPVALVFGVQDTYVERTSSSWTPPQTALNPTDSITVYIIALFNSQEYTLASFSTGALGATELSATPWTVNYWVRYRWQPRFFTDRYWADYGFGDATGPSSFDSFIDNFTYITPA